jgi:hypothetical protein
MPLFGPQIDDRSGAGRDGRPRTLPLLAATLLVAAYLLVVLSETVAAEGPGAVAGAFGGLGLVGAAIALVGTERPLETVAGMGILGPAGFVAIDSLGSIRSLVVTSAIDTVGAADIAVLALGSTTIALACLWGGATVEGAMQRTIRLGGGMLLTIVGGTFVLMVGVALVAIGWQLLTVTDPRLALPGLLVVAIGAGVVWRWALGVLPPALVSRERRPQLRAARETGRQVATGLAFAGLVFLVVSILFVGILGDLGGIATAIGLVVQSGLVRGTVLAVGGGGLVVGLLSAAGNRMGRTTEGRLASRGGPIVGGLVMLLFVFGYSATTGAMIGGLTLGGLMGFVFRLLAVVVGVLLGLIGWLGGLVLAVTVSSVPERHGAATLVGAGPVVAALVLGASGGAQWLVVAGMVVGPLAALLAGVGADLTAELGWRPSPRPIAEPLLREVGLLGTATLVGVVLVGGILGIIAIGDRVVVVLAAAGVLALTTATLRA